MKDLAVSKDYNVFLVDIKNKIKFSQQKAFNAVNQEMILLYFTIGAMIDDKQSKLGWGAKVIDTLSIDILHEFPNMRGFSPRNLKLMVQFYKEYSNNEIVQPAVAQMESLKLQPIVAQIPWTHNIILIQKVKDKELRYWYMEQILQNGWSKYNV